MSHLLAKAAENGNLPDLLRLLDAGADIEWTHKGTGRSALLFATLAGHPALVTALLDRGAQIDRQCKALGYSALAWAAHEGDVALVQLLIERGADLDLASPELRRTPLMCAAQAGQAEALEQLLQAGADGRLLDFKQQNAWALARDKGHETIMQRLEQAGAGARPQLNARRPWPGPTPPPRPPATRCR
ncbi:ankyrin repeat domain-containing protein [Pseudomonas sp. MAFF 302046]|uniref:Ankyrin repeat domain-containing protein n=1 Tax=Pseudomonas morbosilactucae TaxID=2938197 RepID=A0ABT0JNX1_9PSED|nr:ankyrin repeat domain-containing protein [Pseudomonas morbosilactucae]MCK9817567.1 ankyrin repeat domain-containing protein [Pseudomonas morbosilactucae]